MHRAHEAGRRAGWRDAKDGKPVSLFSGQRTSPFGRGYVAGYQTAQVGSQETWRDFISDLVLEHDLTHDAQA